MVEKLSVADSVAIGRGFLRLHQHGNAQSGFYHMGDFVDPRGFVSIYREACITRLDAVHDGRMYIRTWRRSFGDRTLNRLAREFLTDLGSGQ